MDMTRGLGGTLLVVDDEIQIVKVLHRHFRKKYTVLTATNAEAALEIMRSQPVQVVISDQRMPGTRGTDFFTATKTEFPDVVRLLLTGYADIDAVISAINCGDVFRYLMKPWNSEELDSVVAEAFEKYRLVTENRRLIAELREANELLEKRVEERTQELSQANEALQALNERKNQLLGVAAHDLRNPIVAVLMHCEALLDEASGDVPELRDSFLEQVMRTNRFMLNLIDDVLDIARIESGKLDFVCSDLDYAALVRDSVGLNMSMAERKGLTLNLEVSDDVPRIMADRNRLAQVLFNLISNAIKYSNRGTAITVDVFTREDVLVTKVRDQGVGIPRGQLQKIFQPFHKAGIRPTGGEASHGLGLAIVRKIVEAHGGEVTVDSTLGQGSTFTVTLPLSPVAPPSAQPLVSLCSPPVKQG